MRCINQRGTFCCSLRAADVDAIDLLLFQSQEPEHAWNLSELLDQEAWSAALVLTYKQTTNSPVSSSMRGK